MRRKERTQPEIQPSTGNYAVTLYKTFLEVEYGLNFHRVANAALAGFPRDYSYLQ